MKNKVNLITYVDRLADGGLKEFINLLNHELKGIFGGVHLLPFFYPIDGEDAGFDPIDHTKVDHRLGDWGDIYAISELVDITSDLIVNHISAQSNQFLDVLKNGQSSEYTSLFLTKETVFPNGLDSDQLKAIYRPRPGLPFSDKLMSDGTTTEFWTTFTSNQIDIDVYSEAGKTYLDSILNTFAQSGISLIRLDAAGYAVKKAGTSCFMIPETFEFIDHLTTKAHDLGMEVLVEIHSYYKEQIEIAKKVDYVYDFALPPLILHAIYNHTGQYLKKWLDISPRNAITVLDTHDGIGVIDIGPHSLDKSLSGLIPDEDINSLVEEMHTRTNNTSRLATGEAASNLDLYQVNTTYYDALGQDDRLYLLARAIQFFSPGIPQVYYQGFLAEPNDMDLLLNTGVGRDINRHYFTKTSVSEALDRPVVEELIQLIKYRNGRKAFNGTFHCNYAGEKLTLQWTLDKEHEILVVDFGQLSFNINSVIDQ